MKSNSFLIGLCFLLSPGSATAGSFFAGYEFGEMAFNEFKHVAGEVGYKFDSKKALRISFFDVALSERHLSSSEARAVDGRDVEGSWRGIDVYYDFPVTDNIYISPSVGYHDTVYSHTILDQSVSNASSSAGFAVSYLGDNVLGFSQLYWRFSLTFTHRFNPQDKTILGNTVINEESFFETIPLIFVGYRFE